MLKQGRAGRTPPACIPHAEGRSPCSGRAARRGAGRAQGAGRGRVGLRAPEELAHGPEVDTRVLRRAQHCVRLARACAPRCPPVSGRRARAGGLGRAPQEALPARLRSAGTRGAPGAGCAARRGGFRALARCWLACRRRSGRPRALRWRTFAHAASSRALAWWPGSGAPGPRARLSGRRQRCRRCSRRARWSPAATRPRTPPPGWRRAGRRGRSRTPARTPCRAGRAPASSREAGLERSCG